MESSPPPACSGEARMTVEEPRIKHVSFSAVNNVTDQNGNVTTDRAIENLLSSPDRSILSPTCRRREAPSESPADAGTRPKESGAGEVFIRGVKNIRDLFEGRRTSEGVSHARRKVLPALDVTTPRVGSYNVTTNERHDRVNLHAVSQSPTRLLNATRPVHAVPSRQKQPPPVPSKPSPKPVPPTSPREPPASPRFTPASPRPPRSSPAAVDADTLDALWKSYKAQQKAEVAADVVAKETSSTGNTTTIENMLFGTSPQKSHTKPKSKIKTQASVNEAEDDLPPGLFGVIETRRSRGRAKYREGSTGSASEEDSNSVSSAATQDSSSIFSPSNSSSSSSNNTFIFPETASFEILEKMLEKEDGKKKRMYSGPHSFPVHHMETSTSPGGRFSSSPATKVKVRAIVVDTSSPLSLSTPPALRRNPAAAGDHDKRAQAAAQYHHTAADAFTLKPSQAEGSSPDTCQANLSTSTPLTCPGELPPSHQLSLSSQDTPADHLTCNHQSLPGMASHDTDSSLGRNPDSSAGESGQLSHHETQHSTHNDSSHITHKASANVTHESPRDITHESPHHVTQGSPSNVTHESPSNVTHASSRNVSYESPAYVIDESPSKVTHDASRNVTHESPFYVTHDSTCNVTNDSSHKVSFDSPLNDAKESSTVPRGASNDPRGASNDPRGAIKPSHNSSHHDSRGLSFASVSTPCHNQQEDTPISCDVPVVPTSPVVHTHHNPVCHEAELRSGAQKVIEELSLSLEETRRACTASARDALSLAGASVKLTRALSASQENLSLLDLTDSPLAVHNPHLASNTDEVFCDTSSDLSSETSSTCTPQSTCPETSLEKSGLSLNDGPRRAQGGVKVRPGSAGTSRSTLLNLGHHRSRSADPEVRSAADEESNSWGSRPRRSFLPVPKAKREQDDVDFVKPVGVPRTAARRQPSSGSSGTSGAKRSTGGAYSSASSKSSGSSASTGAMDEDAFISSFEDVTKVNLYSNRELSEKLGRIKDVLSDGNYPWEKRVEALKEVRAIVVAGGAEYDDFYQLLRQLEPSFQLSARDLRSQVVREACLSIAYLSQSLPDGKFDHFAESSLQNLISLIPNSAKIMSTAGIVCIRFLLKHTHAPRLVPIIIGNLTSKSNVIRRECLECLVLILHTWPTNRLEKHAGILSDVIKKGLTDADQDARGHARKAYWGYADHFKSHADRLMQSLDPSKQSQLQGVLSNSSSSNSVNSTGGASRVGAGQNNKSRSRSMSSERQTTALYSRTMSGAKKPVNKPSSIATDTTDADKRGAIPRSNSAVDLSGTPVTSSGYGRKPATSSHGTSHTANYSSLRTSKRASSVTALNTSLTNADNAATLPPSSGGIYRTRSKKSGGSNVQSIISPERSRPRNKLGMSQSQPSSRSGSPASRLAYITDLNRASNTPSTPGRPRKSQIPRSQGASREASPSRTYGRERKLSGGPTSMRGTGATRLGPGRVPHQRILTPSTDMEAAVHDALMAKNRRRQESYDSDDASETSSVCSERSYTSSYGRTSEDVSDVLANMSSGSWAERKEGLLALQNLLRAGRPLNRLELKKVTEVFTRMFHDPHGKVFSVFLDTLTELLPVHKLELQDWLYVCLTRLLHKMGVDLLGSVQTKVQRALEAVRDNFAYDHQFSIITRFIVDQTQTPNLKVKVALMNYMHGLAQLMEPGEFANTSDTRLAVSRIITWTTEPKSVDVRKAAQAVLIALFNLNPPEFTMMLSVLPKTFQDGAHKILQNLLRSASQESEPLSPRNVTSPNTLPSHYQPRYRPSPSRGGEDEVENMNPEDINNSIKKMSADIQSLNKLELPGFDDIRKDKETTSQDSGIQGSLHDMQISSPEARDLASRGRQYNPAYYQQDTMNGFSKSALAEAVFDDTEYFNEGPMKNLLGLDTRHDLGAEQGEVVSSILAELSNHNKRCEERKNSMLQLIKITREGSVEVWDEHFKTILLLLLETLGDNDGQIRALALRVLREILRNQPIRFHDYAELTILKVLEAHKDPLKEVMRSAEECAATVAQAMAIDQCVRVLNPIIHTADFPVNLAAIKMQTKVLESDSTGDLQPLLSQIMPGLLKGYDDNESSVRKASVFCLVALYLRVGEALRPYLKDLQGSKVKLLNLYIKRAQSQKNGVSGSDSITSSKNTSPTASSLTDLTS